MRDQHQVPGGEGYPLELSVVIPCLNEAETIGVCVGKAVSAMRELEIEGEVLVVDNGSSDGSPDISRSAGARVVHESRRGYGSALKRGCAEAAGKYILMGDADDSYDFSAIGPFVQKLREGYGVVTGTRLQGKIERGAMPWMNRHFGNPALTRLHRLLFHSRITDVYCGMRAFTSEAYRRMDVRASGMEFAPEMLIRAEKLGLSITEVPITLHRSAPGRRPHLRPWRDGWRTVKLMLLYSPMAVFLIPGFALLVLGGAMMGLELLAPMDRPFILFGLRMDFHWAILGSMLVIVGYQLVTVHFFARVYSSAHRLKEDDGALALGLRLLTFERVLAIACVVIFAGLLMDGWVAVKWLRSGLGPLVSGYTRLFIFGSALLALGFETLFSAFFFSILRDDYEPPAVGAPSDRRS